jgi:putative ABC transport system permease protein
MNITLVSVAERTTEIGTRRALGATRGNVVVQFLAEAVMVSTIGGLIGLLLGILVVFGVNRLTPLPAVISGWSVTAALGFSGVVGLLFGVFPAWKASRLVPMEALRHE